MLYTVISLHYDTAGIRKMYQYPYYRNIQYKFLIFVMVGILIWYHNKQHFELDLFLQASCKKKLHLPLLKSDFFLKGVGGGG